MRVQAAHRAAAAAWDRGSAANRKVRRQRSARCAPQQKCYVMGIKNRIGVLVG